MSLIDDIATYLEDNGIGTVGSTIFKSWLPDNNQNVSMVVLDTGGPTPDIDLTSLKTPTFQIMIRSNTYSAGKSKLDSIRSLLHGVIETQVENTYILYMHAQSEGGHIGRNENGKDEFSINFICKTR